jgi:DNA-binding NarL/FixJ family response regulator
MWWDSSNKGSSRKSSSTSSSTAKRASAKRAAARKRRATSERADASRLSKVRIFLADNQPIDRGGMVALLHSQPDFEVVGESSSAEDAAKQCKRLLPSLAILALRLPAPDGTTALAMIRTQVPEIPILAVAERGEGACMVLNPPRSGRLPEQPIHNGCSTGTDCLQLAVVQGATGTIRRSAEAEELFRAVRTVASGKAWYEAGTATAIMRHALARHGDGHHPSLSDRETEVAELISDGRSNKEIAQALTISEPTVKKHVGHILGKLKLQDRLQVGLYIARNPLVLHRADRARQ